MSSPVRTIREVGPADYAYIKEHVEAMNDREIAAELGVSITSVERMRADLGLRRRRYGKITSPGIEPIADYIARMRERLDAEGVNGDEARMFMRSYILDRAEEIARLERHFHMNTNKVGGHKSEEAFELRVLRAEAYIALERYERPNP